MKLSIARVDVLIWALIYGGLLIFALGLALGDFDATLGHVLWIAGAVVALAGGVLIGLRARIVARASRPAEPGPADTSHPTPEGPR